MGQTGNVVNDGLNLELPEIPELSLWEKQLSALPDKALALGIRVLLAALVLFIGMQLIRLLRRIVRKSMERASVDVGAVHFVDSCLKVTLYIILFMVIASGFGLDATSVVALVGSAGLTLGLALQGSLSNFAGGVLILLIKPFTVGDYIIEDTNKNEGTVQKIDIFYTTLLTFDNKTIVIPNGTLANSSLTNVTGTGRRLLNIKVGISYRADIRQAKEIVQELLEQEEGTLKEEPMAVFVDDLADSAVIIGCRAWVESDTYFPVKWRLTEAIKLAFDEQGVEIPFPQLDVHVHGETAGKR